MGALGSWFFLNTHGIEYELALLPVSVALIFIGGGRYSLDHYLLDVNILETKDE